MFTQPLWIRIWYRQKLVFLFFLFYSVLAASQNENVTPTFRDIDLSEGAKATGDNNRRIVAFNKNFLALTKRNSVFLKEMKMQDYEYIFVAGMGNELFRKTYFSDMVEVLTKINGVPSSQIHIVFPKSSLSVKINESSLTKEIDKIKTTSARKIIIIGHSMGGVIALRKYLDNPKALADPQIKRRNHSGANKGDGYGNSYGIYSSPVLSVKISFK